MSGSVAVTLPSELPLAEFLFDDERLPGGDRGGDVVQVDQINREDLCVEKLPSALVARIVMSRLAVVS